MISRRRVLALGLALPMVSAWRLASDVDRQTIRGMVQSGIQRDANGATTQIFGLDAAEAGDILLRATRSDALPDGFAPQDLVGINGHLVKAIVVDDLRALIDEAADAGLDLYVGSAYRSQTYQEALFAAQVKRWGDEETANRYSARPGHSQHQLGTTIDFTNTFGAFRRSPAADWLRDNAHRFGFVLPYTPAASPLTGYVDEPWHGRWVGRGLAIQLQSLGYQDWSSFDADDVVGMIRVEAGLDDV
jgi:D-alanyl-D-alanine carboxypeptidase